MALKMCKMNSVYNLTWYIVGTVHMNGTGYTHNAEGLCGEQNCPSQAVLWLGPQAEGGARQGLSREALLFAAQRGVRTAWHVQMAAENPNGFCQGQLWPVHKQVSHLCTHHISICRLYIEWKCKMVLLLTVGTATAIRKQVGAGSHL